jgi:hypothetical protein
MKICSYIKIYGPPILEAIERLDELAKKLPSISKGKISKDILVGGESIIGDYDFAFEWKKEPTEKVINRLIFNIDEIFKDLDCRYTVTTK